MGATLWAKEAAANPPARRRRFYELPHPLVPPLVVCSLVEKITLTFIET